MQASSTIQVNHLIEHLFRNESGKMIAVLTRLLGFDNLETAQDIVQDTLLKAMATWSYGRLPENPSAWLYRAAKNRAIDYLRREKIFQKISPEYIRQLQPDLNIDPAINNMFLDDEIQDSQLRMMFACCHPSIPVESQIALSLKTLCGLSVHEIANAFLTNDDAVTKRIYRAKEKIKQEKIELEVPHANAINSRLEAVLQSLYLLFNEGYNSSHPNKLIREDLCEASMRLCHLLTEQSFTNLPETKALLSLMCFQSSRFQSRVDDKGNIIILKYQDRTLWNRALIQRGFDYLDAAAEGNHFSAYHLEAAIASLHAAAPSFERTDWKGVYHLYDILYNLKPGPVIALNKAIASAYAVSKQAAFDSLIQIKGLENHYLYYASLGEMCLGLDKKEEAKKYFSKAIALTGSKSEQSLLQEKIIQCN